MMIKYAYSYSEPNGTYYIGLRTGVVTYKLSASVMSGIASQEGGMEAHLRRHIVTLIDNDELFELLNVTPRKITERGIIAPEEIKELYDAVKFDPKMDQAMKSYAKQVHDVAEESRVGSVDEVVTYIKSLVNADIVVGAKVDEKNPQIVNVELKIPMNFIEVNLKGVNLGSQNRA